MKKIWITALIALFLFGCAGSGSQNKSSALPPSDNSEAPSKVSSSVVEENPREKGLTLLGDGFIKVSGERLKIELDVRSLVDEYLTLRDGRKICQYFIDYDSAFLVFYDPVARTVEPFFDMQAGFEVWHSVQVEQGPKDSLLILCGNRLCRYDLATRELQLDYIQVPYPEEWLNCALISVRYDQAEERYVVAFTQWEDFYLEQNHELILAVFSQECRETGRYRTGAPVLRDSFVTWSVPFIRLEGDKVIFRTFTPEFASQYPELEKATTGLEVDTEKKKEYAKLAQESYREYSYNLRTETLNTIKNMDPFQDINWKLAKYAG